MTFYEGKRVAAEYLGDIFAAHHNSWNRSKRVGSKDRHPTASDGEGRAATPLTLEDAKRLVQRYVEHYNNIRLNSAIGYITPKDMLAGRLQEIHTGRDRNLERRGNSGRIAASGPRNR